jgi:hypothetical protein
MNTNNTMHHRTSKRWFVLMVLSVAGWACDQDPAFVEREVPESQLGNADATAATRPGFKEYQDEYLDPSRSSDWRPEDYKDAVKQSEGGGSDDSIDDPSTAVLQLFDVEQIFSAGSLNQVEMMLDLPSARADQRITLSRQRFNRVVNYTEPTRKTINQQFKQGTNGSMRTESTTQVANKNLDVLVVIDNSGSMEEEQQNLSTKLAPLLAHVADANWQIAVTTTDPNDGCMRDLIRKTDANATLKFQKAVNAGTSGSGNERGIYQAVRALKTDCVRGGWVRSDSTVSVLIVADEDNCSDGKDCAGQPYASASYLTDYLRSIRTVGVNARTYGIVWHPGETCESGYNEANIYMQAVRDTSGTYGSICANDYTSTLQKISADMAVTLAQQLPLSDVPDRGSLQISLNGVVTNDYNLNGKMVVFNQAPAEGTQIVAQYVVGSSPKFQRFKLDKSAYQGIAEVKINGQNLASDQYYIDATSNEVVFNQMPGDLAAIHVSYLEDVVLIDRFKLSGEVDTQSIKLSIDNSETQDYFFDSVAGDLVLNSKPLPGMRIGIRYDELGAAKYRYDFRINGAEPEALQVIDADSGDSVNFAYLNGAVQIASDEFVEGRSLMFSYRNPARDQFSAAVSGNPMVGTITARWENGSCAAENIEVNGGQVSLKKCNLPADIAKVKVEYSDWVGQSNQFDFTTPDLPGARPIKWEVWINNVKTANYSRAEGRKFDIREHLQPGDVVKIIATMEMLVESDDATQELALHR